MVKYQDINGVPFSDADIKRWAEDAEQGFPNSTLTADTPDFLPTKSTLSVELPNTVITKIQNLADCAGLSTSEYVSKLIAEHCIH